VRLRVAASFKTLFGDNLPIMRSRNSGSCSFN